LITPYQTSKKQRLDVDTSPEHEEEESKAEEEGGNDTKANLPKERFGCLGLHLIDEKQTHEEESKHC